MELHLGTTIYTRDGRKVGSIDKVIVNPETGQIRAAVVRKGFLARRDLELPVDAFEASVRDGIRLKYSEADLDSAPAFEESLYAPPPDDFELKPNHGAVGGVLLPIHWSGTPEIGQASRLSTDPVQREMAAGGQGGAGATTAINTGSDVISRDGHKIGEVGDLSYDTSTGLPRHLVVRRGLLFKEDREFPLDSIDRIDDGVVYLKMDSDAAETYGGR